MSFMVLGDSNCTYSFTCNGTTGNNNKEKVLGITIEPNSLCTKQCKMLHGL